MAKVHLHGALAEKFGPEYILDISTAAEAFRALDANLKGFGNVIREGSFRIVRGDLDGGVDLDLDTLRLGIGRDTQIHIIPEIAGAKGKKGGAKAIIGIAVMAVAVISSGGAAGGLGAAVSDFAVFGEQVTFGTIAKFGLSMSLSGVAQMLSPQQKAPKSFEAADKQASFIFNGAVNAQEQGGAIPVVYGRMRVGSAVISGSMNIEQMTARTDPTSVTTSAPTVANVSGVSGVAAGSFTDPIVITKGATAASFLKFTAITGGELYRDDKLTPITNDQHLTTAEIGKGVLFKPTTSSGGSFVVQQLTADLTTVGDPTTATIPAYIFDTL